MRYCIAVMSFTPVILRCLGGPCSEQHFNKQTCVRRLQEAEYIYMQWKLPYTSSCRRYSQCGKRLCLTPRSA